MSDAPEHAVIVHFMYGSTDFEPIFTLEDELSAALDEADAGDLDGDEIEATGEDGYLYLFGPDADHLVEVILPILESVPFMRGATIRKIYGESGEDDTPEDIVTVGDGAP